MKWKRSSTSLLGLLLALLVAATAAGPAAAVDGSASVTVPTTARFALADGTVATVTISGAGPRRFAGETSLAALSGTDAMYAEGVVATDVPAVGIQSSANCGAAQRCSEGRITIRFDRPVDDPAIHIAEWGAGAGSQFASDGMRFVSSDGEASGAVVSPGATFADAGEGYLRGDRGITCTRATAPGGCGSFTVPGTNITTIEFDVARFALTSAQSGFLDAYAFGVTASATPTPDRPALTLSKVVDKTAAVPGDTLEYTITVANTGEAEARQVPVSDVIPAGLGDVVADQGAKASGAQLSWTIDRIPAGGRTSLQVTGVVERSAAGSTLVNRATVGTPADAPEGTPVPSIATPCTDDTTAACARTVVTAFPALSVSKTVDKSVAGHEEALAYTIVVANSGTADAVDVPVVDVLPAELAAVTADHGGAVADGQVRWTLPKVPAGGAVELQVTGITPTGLGEALIVNRAAVRNPADAPSGTPEPAVLTPCPDDAGLACAVTTVPALATLEIGKTVAQSTAPAGSILDYTITVENTGPGVAVDVPVVDDLPDGARFVSASAGGVAVKDRAGWIVPQIRPGETTTLTLRVQVPLGTTGPVVNRATVAYDPVMLDALRVPAARLGVELPDSVSEFPALPPVVAAPACEDDASWSCAVTTLTPSGLAQTGATFGLLLPGALLAAGGAVFLLVGRRRPSAR
ncbi:MULTISPECIES: DUF11 domain-containing protein [Microbacterium]|uniref:DUF11 domain-containing protein n=1 Tax=Microbacterium TaxID=33882 RepID=UPI0011EAACAE|nr:MULTISPECIES: DUF11 domain-containing protein [Microbacterium]